MICCWGSLARKVSRNFLSVNDMLLGFPFKRNQGMILTPSQKLASHIIISKILWVSHFPTCKRKIVNELYIWYQGHDWINKIGTYSGCCPLKFWQKFILVLTIPCSRVGLTFQGHCRMSSICLNRCQLHLYCGLFKTSTSTWC
jgi:hypothetical protein